MTIISIQDSFFKKMGQLSCFLFLVYAHNSNINWKKCRCLAWDSNQGPQDGRHRRIQWVMMAAQSIKWKTGLTHILRYPGLEFFLKNGPSPASFFVDFWSSLNKHQYNLKRFNVKKCPSNIWLRDLNPRPSEHEFSPITTRPGLLV